MIWLVEGGTRPVSSVRTRVCGRGFQYEVGDDDVFALEAAENGERGAELADGGGDDLTSGCDGFQGRSAF